MAHRGRDVTVGLVEWLRRRGDCDLDPGLSDAELAHAEQLHRLTVPRAWQRLLKRVHPVSRAGSGARYPDWRRPDEPGTRSLVQAPVEGVLFDVENAGFWWHAWGIVPESVEERLALARRNLARVPRLTPLVGHWYMADTDDSPVFSIVQADLYVPALSLSDLLDGRGEDELSLREYPIGTVPFWSELHAYSQWGHLDGEQSGFGQLAQGGL